MKSFFRDPLIILLCFTILIPRLILLGNGLDSQRIWDTNTPATFRFLEAVRQHNLLPFLESGQKYPLLGSYLHIPVVGAYFLVNLIAHNYSSVNDFVNAYALNEANLFFWIRLSMLLMNLVALTVLYLATARFAQGSKQTARYVLTLCALNFYVTLFSVTPRIHNFAFFGAALTLYASFLLLEKKTWWNYAAAFGTAAFSASVSQSGFTTLVLPVLAHFYSLERSGWSWRLNKKIIFSMVGFAVVTMLLGYPRTLVWVLNPAVRLYSKVLLGDNHILPGLAAPSMPFMYLLASEFSTVWLVVCGILSVGYRRVKKLIVLSPQEILALVHTIAFFVIFGFSNIFSGRFMLAVMPSLFFLLAGIWYRLASYRLVMVPLFICLSLQAYGIFNLSRVAFNGDTRSEAAEEVLRITTPNSAIVSTIDPVLLGITPSPEAASKKPSSERGLRETLIASRTLRNAKSRDITLWLSDETAMDDAQLSAFSYAVVSWSDESAQAVEAQLLKNNFSIIKTVYASRLAIRSNSFIPWDFITPIPNRPIPFALSDFRTFGPTITIYKRS